LGGASLLRGDPLMHSPIQDVQRQRAATDHFIVERANIEFIA
jgi:hypothetical protein